MYSAHDACVESIQAISDPQAVNPAAPAKKHDFSPDSAEKVGFEAPSVHWKSIPDWVADKKAAGDFVDLSEVNACYFEQINPQIPPWIRQAKRLPGLQSDRQTYDWLHHKGMA